MQDSFFKAAVTDREALHIYQNRISDKTDEFLKKLDLVIKQTNELNEDKSKKEALIETLENLKTEIVKRLSHLEMIRQLIFKISDAKEKLSSSSSSSGHQSKKPKNMFQPASDSSNSCFQAIDQLLEEINNALEPPRPGIDFLRL
jgi:monoamine oxidase